MVFNIRPIPVASHRPQRRKSALDGVSFTDVGASQGAGGAVGALMSAVGRDMIESSLEARAAAVAEKTSAAGLQVGQEEGQRAADAYTAGGPGAVPMLDLGDDDTAAGRAHRRARLVSYMAKLETAAEQRAAALADQHRNDPRAFVAAWGAETNGLMESMPPQAREAVLGEMGDKGRRYLLPLMAERRRNDLHSLNADLIQSGEDIAARAASAWRAGDEAQGKKLTDSLRYVLDSRTDIGAEERDRLWAAFSHNIRGQATFGVFDRVLAGGGPEKARAFLADFLRPESHPEWHPDERAKLAAHMEARVRDVEHGLDRGEREAEKAAEGARQAFLSDFEISAHRGERSYADIERAWQVGYLKPHERTSLTLLLDRAGEREAKVVGAIGRVSAALASEGPALDPRSENDRHAVDAHFSLVAGGWSKLPPEDVQERTIQYVSQPGLGILPTPVRSQLRGWLRAGTPDQKVAASDMMERIRNASPQLLNDVAEDDKAMGYLIRDYAGAGIAPAEAVRLAEEGMRVSKGDKEARGEAYHVLIQRAPGADYLRRELNGSWAYRSLLGVPNPDMPADMAREFDDLARAEYLRHGSLEAARKTAADGIRRTWGLSHLGDGPRWMKGAPEAFYGLPDRDAAANGEWMREQLVADLKAGGGMFDPAAGDLDKRAVVMPHPIGLRDRDTGLPLYTVMLKRPGGELAPVLDGGGQLVAWRPDWQTSPAARRHAEARDATMPAARAAREFRKSGAVNDAVNRALVDAASPNAVPGGR